MTATLLRIGFVPLIDAAPLIAARELGYFADEGLEVTLHRQVGWANTRDKLSFGQLDAGHALLGMPLASHLGRDSFSRPLVAVMALGSGGNALTVRRELFEMGVKSATDLAAVMKSYPRLGRPMVGHVFGSSMHHYLLREWLASGGLDPDRAVKLCVIPPPQVAEHMRGGYLDLFCVGEPWNTVAVRQGRGVVIAATTDILPRHPEKVLAVSRQFLAGSGDAGTGGESMIVGLVRATLRGCRWCEDSGNREELAEILSRPQYLAMPIDIVRESLAIDREFGASRHQKTGRPHDWSLRSFAPEAAFPNKMHSAWLMRAMIRWGHLHPGANIQDIANQCCETSPFRKAAASLKVACPAEDFAPMELRHGRTLQRADLEQPQPSTQRSMRPFPSTARVA